MLKKILNTIWNAWKKFAHFLGIIMSHIILTLFYFIIFGLVAIIKKFIDLFSKKPILKSYWLEKDQKQGMDFEQQF